ncbi:DUF5684 domain-containing protein [Zavarzinella formosa]|uniref:DUF5684 domain-containing protein n=1 Tax=Zavarzinella formosa TaxID=360055 RepID=UPI0002ED7E6B|nr:DUF5684 domain-containing protein [Zavarzinella formosa]
MKPMGMLLAMAIALTFAVFVAARWVMYAKAGHPGWASLIPFYSTHVAFKITGRSPWWELAVCFFYPMFIVVWILQNLDLARAFGRSVWFGLGLMLFPFLFYPVLAFGESRYSGPDGKGACATRGTNPFLRDRDGLGGRAWDQG